MALAIAVNAGGEQARAAELFTEAASVLGSIGASRHAARAWVELAHALADSGDLTGALAAHERAARALNLDDPRWRRRTAPALPAEEKPTAAEKLTAAQNKQLVPEAVPGDWRHASQGVAPVQQ